MRYYSRMRTTLQIDDDLVQIARQLAEQRGTSMGRVISDRTRLGLEPKKAPKIRNGVPLFAPKAGAKRPGLELVNRLRD